MTADSQKTLLLWIAGGAGIILIYAAWKDKVTKQDLSGLIADSLNNPGGVFAPKKEAAADPAKIGSGIPPLPGLGSVTVLDRNGYLREVPPAYMGSKAAYIPPEYVAV